MSEVDEASEATTEESSKDHQSYEQLEHLLENKHALELFTLGARANVRLGLTSGLGLTDQRENTYVNLLSGQEVLADKRVRRRGSEVPGYEVSDDLLLAGTRAGAGTLRKKEVKVEEEYLEYVNRAKDDMVASVGEGREKMIRYAVHDLISRALHEGRKDAKSVHQLRRNKPEIKINKMNLEKEKAYWKEQIANAPAEPPNTP